jgi:hypothetical protein
VHLTRPSGPGGMLSPIDIVSPAFKKKLGENQ